MRSTWLASLALTVSAPFLVLGQMPRIKPSPSAERRAPVLVLAFDGFSYTYLTTDSAPTFHLLAREGVSAPMIPSFPTVTFPNFYTLATGLYPEHSGIVANSFWDDQFDTLFYYSRPISREGRWYGGEPIWTTAERQGLKAATMFWVGSEAPIGGHQPTYWMPFDRRIQFESRAVQVLGWLDLPDSLRPDLIMAYFEEPDHTGHEDGPDAKATWSMVLRVDSMLALVVNGLKKRGLYDKVNLLIVADHGMSAVGPERVVFLDDVVDSARVRVINLTPNLLIESRDGDNATLLAQLRKLPHVRVWPRDSVPARLHYDSNPRITEIVGIADDGWTIHWRHGKPVKPGGQHGFDNREESMRALFLAHGPGFKRGVVLAPFENVDFYGLVAALLGVVPARNDGALVGVGGGLRSP